MSARTVMAIEISPHQLRAVAGERDRGSIAIDRTLVVEVPESVDIESTDRFGAWIRERLDEASFPAARATVAIAREHVVLKRLTLPTVDQDELPDMVRLGLGREMLVEPDDAVIDYVVTTQGTTSTTVTAVAAPSAVLVRAQAVLAAAGVTVERIALRAMGVAALVHTLDLEEECVLAIDVTTGGVEFCVVERDVVRFSRAAEMPVAEETAATADRLVTETRRTWMSYRIVESAADVNRVVLLGDSVVTEPASSIIAGALDVPALIVDRHPRISSRDGGLDRVWSLAGLLLEDAHTKIDFMHPRQGGGEHAQRRRRGLIAAAAGVVVLLAGWTIGRKDLQRHDRTLQTLRQQVESQRPANDRYVRDVYRLAHLQRLDAVDVPWLDHVLATHAVLPSGEHAVLDAWQGALEFRGARYSDKTWSVPFSLSIVVEGEASDRAAADAVRAALVDHEAYSVSSSGADTQGGRRYPFGFQYRLTTSQASPGTGGGS